MQDPWRRERVGRTGWSCEWRLEAWAMDQRGCGFEAGRFPTDEGRPKRRGFV